MGPIESRVILVFCTKKDTYNQHDWLGPCLPSAMTVMLHLSSDEFGSIDHSSGLSRAPLVENKIVHMTFPPSEQSCWGT